MEQLRQQTIDYIESLPLEHMASVLDYVQYIHDKAQTQGYPLDEVDYLLAEKGLAEETGETISFDELLEKEGLTYADLAN